MTSGDNTNNKSNNKLNIQILLAVAFFVFSTVVFMQFRTTAEAREKNKNNNQISSEVNELLEQVNKVKLENEQMQGVYKDLLKQYEAKIKSLDDIGEEKQLKELYDELENIRMIAGLKDVKGKGISILLEDVPNPPVNEPGYNPENYIIHSSDVLLIVNELKKAGAQAISVNGERIIATSESLCVGPFIRINGNKKEQPYIINAIGDQNKLFNAVNNLPRITDKLRGTYGFTIPIIRSDNILIPRYSGDLNKLTSNLELADNENNNQAEVQR